MMDMHQVRIYWSTILMTPLLSCLRSFPHLQYITLVLALCLAKLPSSGHTAFLWQHRLVWPPTIEQVSWCSVENLLIFSTSVWSHHNYAPKGTFLCSYRPKPHTWCYYYYSLTILNHYHWDSSHYRHHIPLSVCCGYLITLSPSIIVYPHPS